MSISDDQIKRWKELYSKESMPVIHDVTLDQKTFESLCAISNVLPLLIAEYERLKGIEKAAMQHIDAVKLHDRLAIAITAQTLDAALEEKPKKMTTVEGDIKL